MQGPVWIIDFKGNAFLIYGCIRNVGRITVITVVGTEPIAVCQDGLETGTAEARHIRDRIVGHIAKNPSHVLDLRVDEVEVTVIDDGTEALAEVLDELDKI